jgi:Ca-activated chloride channel family protein
VGVAIEVEATADARSEEERPASVTTLAIDVSGSMRGAPLAHVIRSVDFLLEALRPIDRLGVVAFSDAASVVAEPLAIDDAGKRLLRARVARLAAGGNTNVEAGLEGAAAQLRAAGGPAGQGAIVLLSDGMPNRGATSIEGLREAVTRHRAIATVASLGYGAQHSEDTLSAIGEAGGGGYEYVQDPTACARSFARALGARAEVVAGAIELALAPAEGTEIRKLLGGGPARYGRDGLVLSLPDMAPGAKRLVVVDLGVKAPGADRFFAALVGVQLRWRAPRTEPAGNGAGELTEDVGIEIAAREPLPIAEAAARIALVRADAARGEARALADRRDFAGAAAALRALLAEIADVPGFAPGDGTALADAYDLVLDEATAMERAPSAEAYNAFRKSAVASQLSAPRPPPSSRGALSTRILDLAAGEYPEAYVVVIEGPEPGARHKLREECVIGRSASADVSVASHSISRRHAEIYALEGEFWACDLGSTNTTELNGRPLGTAPEKLRDGDVLRVGEVRLRYEERLKPR